MKREKKVRIQTNLDKMSISLIFSAAVIKVLANQSCSIAHLHKSSEFRTIVKIFYFRLLTQCNIVSANLMILGGLMGIK